MDPSQAHLTSCKDHSLQAIKAPLTKKMCLVYALQEPAKDVPANALLKLAQLTFKPVCLYG